MREARSSSEGDGTQVGSNDSKLTGAGTTLGQPGELWTDCGNDDLLVERHGDHVAVITLNRPHRKNALSPLMYEAMGAALAAIARDSTVRVVMVTGAGGSFCAGGDVKTMNERSSGSEADHENGAGEAQTLTADTEERIEELRAVQRSIVLAIRELPQPVVMAWEGAVAGAGLSIGLAGDIRLASRDCFVVTAFSSVAASGDFGGSWLLPRIVGSARAKELYFFSPRLSALDAFELGIVNHVYDSDTFGRISLDYCERLAQRPPLAIRRMKENFRRAESVPFPEALHAEAAAMVASMETGDHREAVAAFVAKRDPVFRGV